MSETMIERVAIALSEADTATTSYQELARAAIEAMRVPTEEMLDAYWGQTGESKEMRLRTHAYMRRYFAAMISAALKEPTP